MKDLLLLFGVFVLWVGMSRWVLPWLGVPTCMSGNCGTSGRFQENVKPMLQCDSHDCTPDAIQK